MEYLLYMSTVEQIVIVTVVFSGLSVLGLYIVRILVPLETLKKNHEVPDSPSECWALSTGCCWRS